MTGSERVGTAAMSVSTRAGARLLLVVAVVVTSVAWVPKGSATAATIDSWVAVSASFHTCGVTAEGSAHCWGSQQAGQLGNGVLGEDTRLVPTAVDTPAGVSWTSIGASFDHSCGVTTAGDAYCWGSDANGKLGDGPDDDPPEPVPSLVDAGGVTWASISLGRDHTCAVTVDGDGFCWGDDSHGKLGNGGGAGGYHPSPSPIDLPASVSWTGISAGVDNTCGLATDGTAWCWGADTNGMLGNGAVAGDQHSPAPVDTPAGISFASLNTGTQHSCAVTTSGQAWCWGSDADGRLGDDEAIADQHSPVMVDTPSGVEWTAVSPGFAHTCAVTSDGQAYCWGDDFHGRLGNGAGTTTDQHRPSLLDTPDDVAWSTLSAGIFHTCGVAVDGQAYCWGDDEFAQLGNGPDPSGPVSSPWPTGPSTQTITVNAPDRATFGDEFDVAASATSGLPVQISIDGPCDLNTTMVTATDTGTCRLTARQDGNELWAPVGPVVHPIMIDPAVAEVTISDLAHVYDGTRQPVTVRTMPARLDVAVTYAGSPEPPTGAGRYRVEVVVTDPHYTSDPSPATAALVITRATQTITVLAPRQVAVDTEPFELTTSATSGLPVATTVEGPCTIDGRTVTVTATGTCTVTATQDGNRNWRPADPARHTIEIAPAVMGHQVPPAVPPEGETPTTGPSVGPVEPGSTSGSGPEPLDVSTSGQEPSRADTEITEPPSPTTTPAPADSAEDDPSGDDPAPGPGVVAEGDTGPVVDPSGGGIDLHEPSTFGTALPTFGSTALQTRRVISNGLLAILLAMLLIIPVELFNAALRNHYDEIVARFRGPRQAVAGLLDTLQARVPAAGVVGGVLFALTGAAIGSALDPEFGSGVGSLRLWLAQAITFAVTTFAACGFTVAIARRAGESAGLRLRPGGLVLCVVVVVASRLLGLSPGFLYGMVAGVHYGTRPSKVRLGRLTLAQVGFGLVAALASWLALGPVQAAATSAGGGFVHALGAEALTAICVGTLTSMALALLPLTYLRGARILAWNRTVWIVTYAVVLFAFLSIAVNPVYGSLPSTSLVLWLVFYGVLGVAAVAFWAWFRRQERLTVGLDVSA